MTFKKILFLIPLLSFCGGSTVQFNLTGAAFTDSNVIDMIFTFQTTTTSAEYVYPQTCGVPPFPAKCGFTIQHNTDITVGDLPLNLTYNVTVYLRNASGTVLHHGGPVQFVNTKNSAGVTIAVQ